jgi:formylglycine-generating enzyme required for sulfatase activity
MTAAISLEDVIASHGDDDPSRFLAIADHFLTIEDLPAAAAALDRAYGLSPGDAALARQRAAILDQLAVHEHGLTWRYVPAGTFLMGSDHGDPDERPVHPRRLAAFWITDVPIPWSDYCTLAGFRPPPGGAPPDAAELARLDGFSLRQHNKIRLQYCESETERARDWHAHAGMEQIGGPVPRRSAAPNRYDKKPMVAVALPEIEILLAKLAARPSGDGTPPGGAPRYSLPTEAQWEKAARGGLVGRRYAWGDEPPTRDRCDFDRMGDFRLIDPRELPPNGYGLHGMCGGVAEWTADVYDALAYHRARTGDLASLSAGAPAGEDAQRVLRGGSWSDCADAVTVSFRAARAEVRAPSPTIGFRLVRAVA